MRLFEIESFPLEVVATKEFKKEFESFKRSKPRVAERTLEFIEFRANHDLSEPWNNKDGRMTGLKNIWRVHIQHGKDIAIYTCDGKKLYLYALVEHNQIEAGKELTRLMAWIDKRSAADFSTFSVAAEDDGLVAPQIVATVKGILTDELGGFEESLKQIAAGNFEEFFDLVRMELSGNDDAAKDKLALLAMGGPDGLKQAAQAVMKANGFIKEEAPASSSSLLTGVDLTSFETFSDSLRRMPRPQMAALQDVLNDLNQQRLKPNPSFIEVFHGAPRKAAEDIKANGFKLTKGRRGGFMGAIRHVDNNGIFLTDSKALARYFGSNRSEYGSDYEMLSCFIDPSHVLDTTKAPREIEKIGLAIIQKWDGSTPRRIPVAEWWWLMDNKEFVEVLKQKGYTGARFREDRAVRKEAGVTAEANTFCVFDPTAIKVLAKEIMRVRDFYEWLKDNGSDPRLTKTAEPMTESYDPDNVAATINGYAIVVDDTIDARIVTVFDENGKKAGFLNTRRTPDAVGRDYLSVNLAELDRGHRGKGLGAAMFRALLAHLGPRWKGISSYLPDQVNTTSVPAIWKRLGGHLHPDASDYIIVDRKALTEALSEVTPPK